MKANSERVPNKNLKIFDKYPLYHYIVRTLKKVKYIDKIVVNTDSDKIKCTTNDDINPLLWHSYYGTSDY